MPTSSLRNSIVSYTLATLLGGAALCCGGCTNVFFLPSRELAFMPSDVGLTFDVWKAQTKDGVTLHGWRLLPVGDARATVLFFHGNAQNIASHLASVYWMPAEGIEVFLIDYRGYGQSEGSPSLQGLQEDVRAAFEYVDEQRRKDVPFVVFGQSLGGVLALDLAARREVERRIDLLVIDSAFTSFRGIAREKLGEWWLFWPLQYPLSWLISDDANALAASQRLTAPVVFIHGTKDVTVGAHHSERLFEHVRGEKELWLQPEMGHIAVLGLPEQRQRLLDRIFRQQRR
ncbi:MAG: alpha/beta fold hydrolase [Bdellovibrionales bacterium]|nr:alpha/beta fold hydrolase [Bdellovibrionales bacterium]